MQHIENDMDDIFSKAGVEYPLNTSGSNWDAVRAGLDAGSATLPAQKIHYRRFLWLLLLLIPFAWMNYHNKHALTSDTHLYENTSEETIAGIIKKTPITNNKSGKKNNSTDSKTEKNNNPGVISNSAAVTIKKETKNTGGPSNWQIKQPIAIHIQKNNRDKISALEKLNGKNRMSVKRLGSNDNVAVENEKINSASTTENLFNSKNINTHIINNGNRAVNELPYSNLNNILAPLYSSFLNSNIKKQFAQANPNTQNPVSSINKVVPVTKHQSKLYAGLIVGPDFSWIHSQKVKDAGYSVGLSLGYRLNKHFAIELGALYDQKKYFTSGEYFNKTGAGVPANVSIDWLNGGCKMFEVPLLARFNFNISKSAFFVSGGLTSYLMKNEDYIYRAEANGSWYEGHRSYDNSGNHLFANMQWTLGYNLRLSSTTQLRLEPYIKVPVKNIGIGKMPVTSSGIYFGITRDLK
ncbi:MAG: outer membrane beta-barrel protein [Flavitalea sp.]